MSLTRTCWNLWLHAAAQAYAQEGNMSIGCSWSSDGKSFSWLNGFFGSLCTCSSTQTQIPAFTSTGLRYWLFTVSTTHGKMEVSCFPMQSSTVEQVRWGDARSCHDVTVAIATTQVILGQYQTFYAELVGNYMAILCAKNYRYPTCFSELVPT